MLPKRVEGEVHPGFRWGPFTFRVPFYHTRVEWPELLQGFIVAGTTGLALAPILTGYFGFNLEEAVGFIFITSILISSSAIVFGEPFAPGWITPAFPLVLLYIVTATNGDGTPVYPTPEAKFQMMTATSICFAGLVLVLGATGLGRRFIEWLPPTLKGGVVLGAAMAALSRVFNDVYFPEDPGAAQPWSTSVALGVCLFLTFSVHVARYKTQYKWLDRLVSLGLLPGFIAAAVVGTVIGEITYDIKGGILIPPFVDVFTKVSPFAIGWPEPAMWAQGIGIALMGYVILFGDLITGVEVIRAAEHTRPDEKIEINLDRTHNSIGLRNLIMAFTAPFFPTQGVLWTGVHVIIVQRWSEGRKAMDSLYSGIASYYVFGIPLLFLIRPVVTGLEPFFNIALSLTLVLTGFACAYIAMGLPRTHIERGVVLLIGASLVAFDPWVGMAIAVAATFLLVGWHTPDSKQPIPD